MVKGYSMIENEFIYDVMYQAISRTDSEGREKDSSIWDGIFGW